MITDLGLSLADRDQGRRLSEAGRAVLAQLRKIPVKGSQPAPDAPLSPPNALKVRALNEALAEHVGAAAALKAGRLTEFRLYRPDLGREAEYDEHSLARAIGQLRRAITLAERVLA